MEKGEKLTTDDGWSRSPHTPKERRKLKKEARGKQAEDVQIEADPGLQAIMEMEQQMEQQISMEQQQVKSQQDYWQKMADDPIFHLNQVVENMSVQMEKNRKSLAWIIGILTFLIFYFILRFIISRSQDWFRGWSRKNWWVIIFF
jgi:ATP-dependent Zn protease